MALQRTVAMLNIRDNVNERRLMKPGSKKRKAGGTGIYLPRARLAIDDEQTSVDAENRAILRGLGEMDLEEEDDDEPVAAPQRRKLNAEADKTKFKPISLRKNPFEDEDEIESTDEPNYCFLCDCTPNRLAQVSSKRYEHLYNFILGNWGVVDKIWLITKAQDLYNTTVRPYTAEQRVWFRRVIHNHFTSHHPSVRFILESQFETLNRVLETMEQHSLLEEEEAPEDADTALDRRVPWNEPEGGEAIDSDDDQPEGRKAHDEEEFSRPDRPKKPFKPRVRVKTYDVMAYLKICKEMRPLFNNLLKARPKDAGAAGGAAAAAATTGSGRGR